MTPAIAYPYGSPDRPLVVCDVDEVVLEFVQPFRDFLASHEFELVTDSFKLTGNIRPHGGGGPLDGPATKLLLSDFFAEQERWQRPAIGAAEALAMLAQACDLVFLSAMPPQHAAVRRRHLDALGLHAFPLIADESPKGVIVQALRGAASRPAAFIDDLPHNHAAVMRDAPGVACIHLMANADFRALMPPLPEGIAIARDWPHCTSLVQSAFAHSPHQD